MVILLVWNSGSLNVNALWINTELLKSYILSCFDKWFSTLPEYDGFLYQLVFNCRSGVLCISKSKNAIVLLYVSHSIVNCNLWRTPLKY